ncbi:MAG: hypothetical protein IJP23_05470 [Oscillospiraceae bacterium]|nr:hypothetical protein [Oscillospiraceae bacterium]
MCRILLVVAVGLVALGVGLLLATVFPAGFLVGLIALGLIVLGTAIFNKNR